MKEILLANSDQVALVDDDMFDYLNQWCWRMNDGYARTNRKILRERAISMHNLITGVMGIDHIDGNRLNNQRHNLRIATPAQNNANRRIDGSKSEASTSRFKGVYWNKARGRWHVQLCQNRQKYSLGMYADELEAARAYNQAAIKFFGEFARLNPVDE